MSSAQPSRRRGVDQKVYDLAELFLEEIEGHTTEDIWALADAIQAACEDTCRDVEEREGEVRAT